MPIAIYGYLVVPTDAVFKDHVMVHGGRLFIGRAVVRLIVRLCSTEKLDVLAEAIDQSRLQGRSVTIAVCAS